jgi:hypothetical protein
MVRCCGSSRLRERIETGQFGLRAAVGTRTLDALLEDKGAVDQVVFDHVRGKFDELGIAVRGIGVKGMILPR